MNDIYVTLSGNVTHDPRQFPLPDGSRVTLIRVATSRRYLDRHTQEWLSSPPTFFAVRCYRGLADNAAQSIRRGQPVVVHGRLRIREFERDGERRFIAEIEATSVGHDLKWGIATFEKPLRSVRSSAADRERAELERSTLDWAQGGGTALTTGPADNLAALEATEEITWSADERPPADDRLAA
ncbi:single-stranded DNA-binding protein [Thermopolyspora sp. NPDC052614]|uniref:single-stranded DNA-binding protein n=1 Tax=Thermopolyspora sp. NPDC052614 TaxID=3155682 RepID=UPI0034262E3E